jgi:dTDP-4-dehydrorhamnose reductase
LSAAGRAGTSRAGGVLLLGGSGLLGVSLVAVLVHRGWPFAAPSPGELDLERIERIVPALEALRPDAVVNAAAWTGVARAEDPTLRDRVYRMNRDAPEALAHGCRKLGIPIVHVSTDYVFDGSKASPYVEDDPPNPLQVYGRSKLEGERAVLSAHPGSLVVRTSTLFGPGAVRPSYVDAILRQARQSPVIQVVELPRSSPTYAPHLAEAIVELLDGGARGVVHAVNSGDCTRLELARAVVEEAGFGGTVEVRVRPDQPGGTPRPPYSVLDTARLAARIGSPLRPWRSALAEYLEVPHA